MLYKIPFNTRVTQDDARAFTRFAKHQANDLCFPRIHITTCGLTGNGIRMPTDHYIDGHTVGIGLSATGWSKHQLPDNNDLLLQCSTQSSDHLRGSSNGPHDVPDLNLSLQ